jgi:hypothetical protein
MRNSNPTRGASVLAALAFVALFGAVITAAHFAFPAESEKARVAAGQAASAVVSIFPGR